LAAGALDTYSQGRQLLSRTILILQLAAILTITIGPPQASAFADLRAQLHDRTRLHRVTVFSDDPTVIHDPRHKQPQTGFGRMFAPIGLVWTNHPQPDQGAAPTSHLHMGTAFLVSPCYILTAYHVVLGYRTGYRKGQPQAERDVSATFGVAGKTSRAVPVKYGRFSMFPGQDWALLQLQPGAKQRCLGEDPNIGWVRLAPLIPSMATKQSLSVAGYPADKDRESLWRQDACHFFERYHDVANDGLWTTDCATRPRASGAPIFFIKNGVLNVVAVMSGHLGNALDDDVLPKWDPSRANLALDIGKIIASDPDFLKLIESDIARARRPNPARVR
jgi:V8-like Glu-specific endopeptidase